MIILDTSFLFAYYREQDVHHKTAVDLAKEIGGETVIVPVEVFEELITVVTRKFSSKAGIEVGKKLLSNEFPVEMLRTADNVFQNAWANFQALDPHSFSFVDCILIALSK